MFSNGNDTLKSKLIEYLKQSSQSKSQNPYTAQNLRNIISINNKKKINSAIKGLRVGSSKTRPDTAIPLLSHEKIKNSSKSNNLSVASVAQTRPVSSKQHSSLSQFHLRLQTARSKNISTSENLVGKTIEKLSSSSKIQFSTSNLGRLNSDDKKISQFASKQESRGPKKVKFSMIMSKDCTKMKTNFIDNDDPAIQTLDTEHNLRKSKTKPLFYNHNLAELLQQNKISNREKKILKGKVLNLITTSTARTCNRFDNHLKTFNKKLLTSFESVLENNGNQYGLIMKYWKYFIPQSHIYKYKLTLDSNLSIFLSESQFEHVKEDLKFYFEDRDLKELKCMTYFNKLVHKLDLEDMNHKKSHSRIGSRYIVDKKIEDDDKAENKLDEKILKIRSILTKQNRKKRSDKIVSSKHEIKREKKSVLSKIGIDDDIISLSRSNSFNHSEIVDADSENKSFVPNDNYNIELKTKLENQWKLDFQKMLKTYCNKKIKAENRQIDIKIEKIKEDFRRKLAEQHIINVVDESLKHNYFKNKRNKSKA